MRVVIESYDGHDLNDSNYHAFIPLQPTGGFLNLADANEVTIARYDNYPSYAGKELRGKSFVIAIYLLGTYSTQLDELKKWFDTRTKTLKKLVVSDPGNSDKQWYIMCACTKHAVVDGPYVEFVMYANDPTLLSNTAVTDTWSVTASAQTKVLAPGGNVAAKPVITIKPTSAKGGGYAYKKFITLKNPHTNAFSNYPFEITDGGFDHAALVKVAANKVQINSGGGIADDATTIPYDNEGGTFPSSGIAYIDGATKEQISYTAKTATELTGVTRGINGTTAAAHADDVWIHQSKVQADGDDVRVFIDGKEVSRWSDNWNEALTKVWINIDLKPILTTKIMSAISDSGAVTTIPLFYSTVTTKTKSKKPKTSTDATASLAFLKGINPSGGAVMINGEIFTYTGVDLTNYQLTGCTRATKLTTAAAHSAQDVITYIEHDAWFMYGSITEDPVYQDEYRKPIIDLESSTNDSWVYAIFSDEANLRTGRWSRYLYSSVGKQSLVYTGDHGALADPATEMGMSIKAYQYGGRWLGESATLYWELYHPAGVTHVSGDGEQYRNSVSWPIYASLQKGTGKLFQQVWNLTTPSVISTWSSWTKNSEALGATYNYLWFLFSGSVGALLNAEADMEVSNVTLTLDSAKRPTVSMSSEEGNYWLDLKLTNNTSGEYIYLTAMTPWIRPSRSIVRTRR